LTNYNSSHCNFFLKYIINISTSGLLDYTKYLVKVHNFVEHNMIEIFHILMHFCIIYPTRMASSVKECSGTSRLSGAGPLRIRPDAS